MSGTLLLFGGSGRTGQCVRQEAERRGLSVLAPPHAECDLEHPEQVSDYVLAHEAEVVINCAAVSGLESCADDLLRAHLVNAASPAAMALACRHTGARFIHLSTDYVLDGRRPGKKDEGAHCRPCCAYAESKREGELEIAECLPDAVIARVSWVCGNAAHPAFPEQVLRRALRGEPLAAVADKYSLPTDAADIARAVLALAATDYGGIIHLCSGGEPLSWWDCACLALREAVALGALPPLPEPERQALDSVPFFREKRPRHTAMDNSRLLSLGIAMPTAAQTIAGVTRRFLSAAASDTPVSPPSA